jgi:hypothetical protein
MGAMLAVLVAACGGGEPTNTPTPGATSTPTPTAVPGQTPTPGAATATPTPTPGTSFDAAAHFRGKTIKMLVGYAPGGGTDAQARYFAANWPKYIPGNPKMVVQNLTPVITERNFVWNAKPDGLTLGTEANAGINEQLEGAAQFDMRDVSAVGATSGGDLFWAIWHTLGYGCADTAVGGSQVVTLADGIASAEDMGSTAFGVGMAARAFSDAGAFPLRLVHVAGDTGSNAQRLMLERGDINSWSTNAVWTQLPRTSPGWVRDGLLKPFLDMSFSGHIQPGNSEDGGVYGCKKLEDYAPGGLDNAKVKEFYQFNDVRSSFSKNIVGPPGMDPNVLNALRGALDDAMNDLQFVEGMERASGIPTAYTSGATFEEDLQRIADGFLNSQDEYKQLRQELYDTYVQ